MNKLKLQSIISAVAIYLILIISVFIGSIYTPSTPKATIYTEKKSDIIEVSLGTPLKKSTPTHKKKKKKKKKPHKKKKPPKKIRNTKPAKHEPKKRASKKSKIKHKTAKTKPKASSLFKNLPNSIADDSKPSSKPEGKSGKSAKKVNKQVGVVDKYRAHMQQLLYNFPAQSNFAGERVVIKFTVYADGKFDYKFINRSLNPEFNTALKAYLKQLNNLGGFGAPPKQPFTAVVEFIAKG